MKTLQHRWCALAALFVAFGLHVSAQSSTWLTHDASWQIEGRELIINIATITNPTAEDSGPLFLSIYAQSGAAYDGGPTGQLLSRAPIDSIPANGRVDNVSIRTRVRVSKAGLKFTALMLEKQNGKQFTIVDWVAFTSTYSFPRKQNGGVGSDDNAIGRGDIEVASMAFTIIGKRASVNVGKIHNKRELETTGRIRLSLYATAEPYTGGSVDGPELGDVVLGELAPGDYFQNLSGTIKLKLPKAKGSYYVTLRVEEDTETGFVPITYLTDSTPREL